MTTDERPTKGERSPRRKERWSKGRVRTLAWMTGGLTFLAGFGILGAAPKPSASAAPQKSARWKPARQKVIVRHVTRRVVIVDPVASAPVYYAPSSGGGTSTGSPSGSGTTAPAPAPPPPPTSGS